MPPPTWTYRYEQEVNTRSLTWWVRGLLLAVLGGLLAVFAVAAWLDPYESDGSPRRMATHQQLGLPPCSFVMATALPCPACGMTTSFALLIRADVGGSLRANWVGTLLAGFCLLVIPWAGLSVARGRVLLVGSLERALIGVLVTLLVLMMLRWAVVVGARLVSGAWPV